MKSRTRTAKVVEDRTPEPQVMDPVGAVSGLQWGSARLHVTLADKPFSAMLPTDRGVKAKTRRFASEAA